MAIKVRTVSMPEELLEAAKVRAAAEGRSLSNYVQMLLRKELQKGEGKNANKRNRSGDQDGRG
jgi:plasmid stability protein